MPSALYPSMAAFFISVSPSAFNDINVALLASESALSRYQEPAPTWNTQNPKS
jgi:hypothetical protein